jgi:hypothetical protein
MPLPDSMICSDCGGTNTHTLSRDSYCQHLICNQCKNDWTAEIEDYPVYVDPSIDLTETEPIDLLATSGMPEMTIGDDGDDFVNATSDI